MNTTQAHHQSLKDALTTLLKTPPDYWNIQEDFVMIGYVGLGALFVRGSAVDVSLRQSVILHDPLLAMDIRKLAQQTQAAHDPETSPATTTPMKIPSIGNYLTEDKQRAIVDELGENLCSGRVVPDHSYVVWRRDTGEAFVPPFVKAPSLSIVSPAPTPWRERIIQLIETAHRDPAGGARLISGDVTFHMDCSRVTVFRESPKNNRHTVHLTSPEILGAFKARMTQLATEAARAHDDNQSAAIEALLQ